MKTAIVMALLALVLPVSLPAGAEHGHTPYAGWEGRAIKALSAEQMDDLRNGRGMGLALAAELNGYPGPRHVLELAQQLDLTTGQEAQAQRLFDAMQAEAITLGEQVIAAEAGAAPTSSASAQVTTPILPLIPSPFDGVWVDERPRATWRHRRLFGNRR